MKIYIEDKIYILMMPHPEIKGAYLFDSKIEKGSSIFNFVELEHFEVTDYLGKYPIGEEVYYVHKLSAEPEYIMGQQFKVIRVNGGNISQIAFKKIDDSQINAYWSDHTFSGWGQIVTSQQRVI